MTSLYSTVFSYLCKCATLDSEQTPNNTIPIKIHTHITLISYFLFISKLYYYYSYGYTISHLDNQLPARQQMTEEWGIVIFIQYSDMGGACSTSRWSASVLYHHHQLVTGLVLTIQSCFCADLT